jgi:transcriptional regulator GlxA family with amidase domain
LIDSYRDNPAMHHIAVVAMPPVTAFDIAIPSMIFGSVSINGEPGYDVRVCTLHPGTITTSDAVGLVVRWSLRILKGADTVIVTGAGSRDSLDPAVLSALRRAHKSSKRVASICTGAFALAQSGILDGRSATTYWLYSEEFRRRFAGVDVRPDVLFVEDGNVVTSAGAAAGIDLCLHLVTKDYGAAVANDVARLAVVSPARAGGQAQFIQRPVVPDMKASLSATREWARKNLEKRLSLSDLAARSHLSERTLTRRFREETGISPLQWLLQQRIDRARELLETTTLPMDRVAQHSGLGNADSLRQHFSRRLSISPGAYRAAFRRDRLRSH